MQPKQIDLIRQSFKAAREKDDLSRCFYEDLFSNAPQLRGLFPENMSRQQQKMSDSLSLMVELLDKPGALASMLIPLGRRHGPYNIELGMFSPVFDALKSSVARLAPEVWNDEIDRAWNDMSDAVGSQFMRGLEQANSEHDNTPEILMEAQVASAALMNFSQEEIDSVAEAIYKVGFDNRVLLAEMAVEETGMGRVESKVYKNILATLMVWEDIKDVKTVGVVGGDGDMVEIAQPMGVVLGVIPVTNPTSTTLYKIISAIKARNSIIITGASRAANCTNETARLAYEAAIKAGAPEGCIQWVEKPNRVMTQNLMSQPDIAIILATGGEGLVNTAYSSGTPAFGVGAGNVPVLIDDDFDVDYAVSKIIESKNFDYGTICASEQSVICTEAISNKLTAAFRNQGAYILDASEVSKLENVAISAKGTMHPDIVGKPATFIAKKAGLDVPDETCLLVVPLTEVGRTAPLSQEILAPILAMYTAPNMLNALNIASALNHFGGVGHTAAIYSDNPELIEQYGNIMNAGRILVNVPTSGGAVGIGTMMTPSLTLGCGTGGGNITTNNISARDLMNIQRVAMPKSDQSVQKLTVEQAMDRGFRSNDAEACIARKRLN